MSQYELGFIAGVGIMVAMLAMYLVVFHFMEEKK